MALDISGKTSSISLSINLSALTMLNLLSLITVYNSCIGGIVPINKF